MIAIAYRAIALSAVSFLIAGIVLAQVQPKSSVKKGIVTGTVTIKGKPAPEIVVGLIVHGPGVRGPAYQARTDREGKYRISDVTPGSYSVIAAAPAYVVLNRERGNDEGLVVIGGETIEGINFDLVRGGAMSGKVVDGDGNPVIEQQVYLVNAGLGADPRAGGIPTVPVQTDDRGQFRMFGIAAGKYKVAAGPSNEYGMRGAATWQQGFYPDHSDAANATVLDVSEGSDISNINIALNTVQTFLVSGRVIDRETGQPISGVRFALRGISPDQRSNFAGNPTLSSREGDFTIENVLPGKYGMYLLPSKGSDHRADMVPIEISTQDVTGLVIKAWKGGAIVSGVLVMESTDDKAVWSRLLQVRLGGFIQKAGSFSMFNSATINADGSFSFSGLDAGTFVVSLNGSDPNSRGFRVSRIERSGVAGRSIEVKEGERITDVKLIFNYGNATVYGIVKFDNASLPSGARSHVRLSKQGFELYPESDARGSFMIDGMPSGTYELEVSVYLPGSLPGSTRNVPSAKQQLVISDGATTNVVINVDNPEPRPAP